MKMKNRKYNLIIIDNQFPNLISSFRIAEFNEYLKKFKNSIIYSTQAQFDNMIGKYEKEFSQFRGRVLKFDKEKTINANLIYMLFIHNTLKFLSFIEKNQIPFVFTIYPGGGFKLIQRSIKKELKKILSLKTIKNRLFLPLFLTIKNHNYKNSLIIFKDFWKFAHFTLTNDKSYINNLKRVFSSPYFRKVIVTQKIIYNYLIKKNFCKTEDIEFIYGGVSPTDKYHIKNKLKIYYPFEKNSFDICFVAYKYIERGLDKGYDIFIDIAKKLYKQYDNIYFHVVGNFSEEDINVSEIRDRIKFYGFLETSQFIDFYKKQDIILSPNRSFVLNPGSFDGFLLGTCVEAGINGVALFISDTLNQNIVFKNNEEILIIKNNIPQILSLLDYYYKNPDKLYNLARKGTKKIWDTYNLQAQMKKRIELLSKYLNIN